MLFVTCNKVKHSVAVATTSTSFNQLRPSKFNCASCVPMSLPPYLTFFIAKTRTRMIFMVYQDISWQQHGTAAKTVSKCSSGKEYHAKTWRDDERCIRTAKRTVSCGVHCWSWVWFVKNFHANGGFCFDSLSQKRASMNWEVMLDSAWDLFGLWRQSISINVSMFLRICFQIPWVLAGNVRHGRCCKLLGCKAAPGLKSTKKQHQLGDSWIWIMSISSQLKSPKSRLPKFVWWAECLYTVQLWAWWAVRYSFSWGWELHPVRIGRCLGN